MAKISNLGNPPQVKKEMKILDNLRGVDLTTNPVDVNILRSTDILNLMPSADGFPIKRCGFEIIKSYDESVNGAYTLKLPKVTKQLYHIGTKLYLDDTVVYSEMANSRSHSQQIGDKLIILDGTNLLVYAKFDEEFIVKQLSEVATVPTITKGRLPSGGGASFNPINKLTDRVIEEFSADGTSKAYTLSFKELPEESYIKVEIKNTDGEYIENKAYSLDRVKGVVNFTSAPSKPSITGEDNVKITYQKKDDSKEDLTKCKLSVLYGVQGQPDRIWLSGNSEKPNYAWYSQFDDPYYFGDTWYIVAGSSKSDITGFSVLENKMVIHKENEELGKNAFVISNSLEEDGDALFKIDNVLQGEGAISCFNTLNTEPLFLTRRGIYAITRSDVYGNTYTQNRSYYINGEITKLQDLKNAICTIWKGFYILCKNGKAYLLDGEQKYREKYESFSEYQYECYVWGNINANCIWVEDNILHYGDTDGNIHKMKAGDLTSDYCDDFKEKETITQKPVVAYWSTGLLNLGTFAYRKTITGVWIVCKPYTRSGVKVYFKTNKSINEFIQEENIDVFNFNDIDFERFTFNTVDEPSIVFVKKKAKKVNLFKIKLENDRTEPFGILSMQIEYRIAGKIK